jgi:Na+/proline symporter
LFGVGLFVFGIVFLVRFWKRDDPRAAVRAALRSKWVWFFTVLAWVAFGFEIAYLASRS